MGVVTLITEDPTVTVTGDTVAHATWPAGHACNNSGLSIRADASASGDVTFTIVVTAANGGPWQFTHTVTVVPKPRFVFRQAWLRDKDTGDGDGSAEPGERVQMRARLKNDGSLAGENVTVALRALDSGAVVVRGVVAHETWPSGEGRNNIGLVVDLADDVGASVEFALDVTAANGGPWQFQFTVPTAAVQTPTAPAGPRTLAAHEGDITSDGDGGLAPFERIRAALTPAMSTLLPNYPNPFNPDTWIPFDLA